MRCTDEVWTLRRALHSSQLWAAFTMTALGVIGYQIITTHQVAHAVNRGFHQSTVVWLFAFGAGCTMAGTLGGWLSDQLGRGWVFVLGSIIAIAGIGCLAMIKGPHDLALLVSYTASGFGFGMRIAQLSTIPADIFSGPHLGAILEVVQAGGGLGGSIGPFIDCWLFDVTGSYGLAFLAACETLEVPRLNQLAVRRRSFTVGTRASRVREGVLRSGILEGRRRFMTAALHDLFATYPALARHLVPALQRTRRAETHPLITRLRADRLGPHFMHVLNNLLASAESVRDFNLLVRKLAEAREGDRSRTPFLDAVAELTVVSRLVRLGAADVGLVATGDNRSPDARAVLRGETVYFEVTRLTGVNARQRTHEERVKALTQEVEAFVSPFDVTFIPGAEYEANDVWIMAALIREALTALEAAGTLQRGGVETIVFPSPRFGLWVSLKAGKAALLPTTKFRQSSELAFASPKGHDDEKLRAKITEKYGQCVAGALNVLVIQPVRDVLDDAARDLGLDFLAAKRPRLTTVMMLSSWPGNSRVLANPRADPAAPDWLIDALTELAELDDDMWTAGPDAPSLGHRRALVSGR